MLPFLEAARNRILTPDRLPGLAAWYSADYGVLNSVGPDVAATDGQTVRRWLDRSGNGRHLDQATLVNQPTFSGGRVVFNNTLKNYLSYASGGPFTFAGAGAIFCVVKVSSAPTNGYGAVIAQYTSVGTTLFWSVQDYPNAGVRHTLDAYGNRANSKSVGISAVETYEGFSWSNWQTGSGIVGATGRNSNVISSTGSGSPSSLPAGTWSVGTTDVNIIIDPYLSGSIAEIVCCTSEMNPAILASYAARKWGVAL